MSENSARFSRRTFLHSGALAAAVSAVAGMVPAEASAAPAAPPVQSASIGAAVYEASISQLQAAMQARRLSARDLVQAYSARISALDQAGPTVRSVLEVNPDALAIADALDKERAAGRVRGPLHGIPILIKDNIDTNDKMLTTAGSVAMVGTKPTQDATVAAKLREAGAIILGKTNLSEWANFRSTQSSSGWSGRGRQTKNPYVLDRNPCGSSSGSGAAVAASFCAAALGTETDGSIVCPSSLCGVVGIKPTVGLTSRAGVIPISATQDTIGPHARSVADAALVLNALVGPPDPRDSATAASAGRFPADYTRFLDPNGL
ncbi:MAG: amidase family protein, partial [Chloroflexaceae bacterium]|nr:amidase family protein [Chloroflexaceae bacterium]